MLLLSGVELLFGLVELDDGLVEVLFEFVEFMSELLELEVGEVVSVELLLDGVEVVEFMSELLLVVEDGEVELLDPVWLDCVDGVLCALLAPLPAPFASLFELLLVLCATAIPVEKITAVAIVRSFLLMPGVSCALDSVVWGIGWPHPYEVCQNS